MGRTDAEKKAQQKYAQKFQRPAIYMTAEKLERVKAHADAYGESVNAFANRAIDEALQRDSRQVVQPADVIVHLTPEQHAKAEKAAKRSGQTVDAWIADAVYKNFGKHTIVTLEDKIARLTAADAEVRGVSLDSLVEQCIKEFRASETDEHKKAVEAVALTHTCGRRKKA